MDELDNWMKKYITNHRMKFLENLTEIFVQGFPGLHPSVRNRITCRLRQDGYITGNSELLDCIMRIDNFPILFIQFCKTNDCTPELAKIIQEGITEYDRLLQNFQERKARQALRQRHEDNIGASTSIPRALESDKGSADWEAAGALVCGPMENNESDPAAIDIVNPSSEDANNATTEDRNRMSVVSDGLDKKSDTFSSEGRSEYLLRQLKSIKTCVDGKKEETNNNCVNSNAVDNENKTIGEQECTDTGLVCINGDSRQILSNSAEQVPCPCPYHANVIGEERDLPYNNESQLPNPLSDIENIQRNHNLSDRQHNNEPGNENIFPICDSNNMNRIDPIKNTYGIKMTVPEENLTAKLMNKANATTEKQSDNNKLENVLSFAGSCESSGKNTEAASDNKGRPSIQRPESENMGECISRTSQEQADSSESYYLTSSDEEEFLPEENGTSENNHADSEIENLKLISDEQLQNSAKAIVDGFENTIPKEIKEFEHSETSDDISRDIEMKNESKYDQESELVSTAENVTEDEGLVKQCSTSVINSEERNESIISDTDIEKDEGERKNEGVKHNFTGQPTFLEDQCERDSCSSSLLGNAKVIATTEMDGNSFSIEEYDLNPTETQNDILEFPTGSESFEVCYSLSGSNESNCPLGPYSNNFYDSYLENALVNSLSSESSETPSVDFSDKLNVEDRTQDREAESDAQPLAEIHNHIKADNSVHTTFNPNNTSDHKTDLQESTQDITNNHCIGSENNGNTRPIEGSTPNTRSNLFGNIYTPMRNIIQNYFPELNWF